MYIGYVLLFYEYKKWYEFGYGVGYIISRNRNKVGELLKCLYVDSLFRIVGLKVYLFFFFDCDSFMWNFIKDKVFF